jgi:ankyrin repeat protein
MDELKRFLIQNVPDINATNEFGCTALWFAARDGNVECVTALLDTNADANKADDMGVAPLHKASSTGSVECVRVCCLCGPI